MYWNVKCFHSLFTAIVKVTSGTACYFLFESVCVRPFTREGPTYFHFMPFFFHTHLMHEHFSFCFLHKFHSFLPSSVVGEDCRAHDQSGGWINAALGFYHCIHSQSLIYTVDHNQSSIYVDWTVLMSVCMYLPILLRHLIHFKNKNTAFGSYFLNRS